MQYDSTGISGGILTIMLQAQIVVLQELTEETIADVLGSLRYATEAAEGWAKAWHNWALFNVQVNPCVCFCLPSLPLSLCVASAA